MKDQNISRRHFNRLSGAAFAGLLAGCNYGGKTQETGSKQTSLLLKEPHVCRGLNTCRGKGACKTAKNACKGKNACAGQGGCATAEKHACAGNNKCKGQGGCGSTAGRNACRGKGECAVPLKKKAWAKTRPAFEKAYEAKYGKKPGPAPAKA